MTPRLTGLLLTLFFCLVLAVTRFATPLSPLAQDPYPHLAGSAVGHPAGLAGFIAEFMVFSGAFPVFMTYTIVSATSVIITAAYYLWAIHRMFLGKVNEAYRGYPDLAWRERFTQLAVGIVVRPISAQTRSCTPRRTLRCASRMNISACAVAPTSKPAPPTRGHARPPW